MKFMGNLPGKRLLVCNQKCRPTVNNFFNDRRSRKYLIAFLQDLPALIFLSIPLIINVAVTIVTICIYHINCSLNSGQKLLWYSQLQLVKSAFQIYVASYRLQWLLFKSCESKQRRLGSCGWLLISPLLRKRCFYV